MARNKDSRFGAADGFDFDNKYEPEIVAEKSVETTKYEKRSKQIGVVVTPTMHQALKELRQQGKIKSANDLINELLEEYVEKLKAL